MADRRIDQLTESAEIADDDLFVIWKQNISQTRSIQMQNVFNVGIQSIIDRITQWTDITTDFSITGTTNGFSLTYVKYNSALKQLKAKYLLSGAGAGNVFILELIYNGQNPDIAFSDDTFVTMCKRSSSSLANIRFYSLNYLKRSDTHGAFHIPGYGSVEFQGGEITLLIQL